MAYTTIDNPLDYFETILYTGNGSSQNIGGLDFQPDWVWIKSRSLVKDHDLYDSVRGADFPLESNTNVAEQDAGGQGLTSFRSDGFAIGNRSTINSSSATQVSWNWKKTATAGFDIVSYTGNGSNRTISHSLSAVPKMMIVKNRDANEEWTVYHAGNTSAPATDYLALNTNGATTDNNNRWNDTAPTSSVFTLGTTGNVNANGQKFINYLFSEVKGYSKFSSYIGNGNDGNGPFIFTGFKPAFCMVKRSSASGENWLILDNKRDSFNPQDSSLYPNLANAEDADGADYFDFYSNGMKVKTNNGGTNTSGATCIFMAFAEQPFVTSTGVPTTAR